MIYLLWVWSFPSLNFEVGEVPVPVMVRSLLSDSICCRKKSYKLSAKYKKKMIVWNHWRASNQSRPKLERIWLVKLGIDIGWKPQLCGCSFEGLVPSLPKADGWNSESCILDLRSLGLTKQLEMERGNPGRREEQQSVCINTPQILGWPLNCTCVSETLRAHGGNDSRWLNLLTRDWAASRQGDGFYSQRPAGLEGCR